MKQCWHLNRTKETMHGANPFTTNSSHYKRLELKKGMAVTPSLKPNNKGKAQLATAGQLDCRLVSFNCNSAATTFDLFTTLYRPLPYLRVILKHSCVLQRVSYRFE